MCCLSLMSSRTCEKFMSHIMTLWFYTNTSSFTFLLFHSNRRHKLKHKKHVWACMEGKKKKKMLKIIAFSSQSHTWNQNVIHVTVWHCGGWCVCAPQNPTCIPYSGFHIDGNVAINRFYCVRPASYARTKNNYALSRPEHSDNCETRLSQILNGRIRINFLAAGRIGYVFGIYFCE